MGFLKTAAKIVFFPVYVPYKVGKKVLANREQENPVFSIVTTSVPEVYQYYFSGLGHETDIMGNNLIIWRKGIKEKEKKAFFKKLNEAGV